MEHKVFYLCTCILSPNKLQSGDNSTLFFFFMAMAQARFRGLRIERD